MVKKTPRVFYYSGSAQHPYYLTEYKHLPKSIEWVASNSYFDEIEDKKKKQQKAPERDKKGSKLIESAKGFAIKVYKTSGIPKIIPMQSDCDLIWSCGFMVKTKTPYVMTLEDVSALYLHDMKRPTRRLTTAIIKRYLERDECRAILPWTQASKNSLLAMVKSDKIAQKTKVLYPCIETRVGTPKKQKGNTVHILCDGTNFLHKGGYETYLAFKDMKKELVKAQKEKRKGVKKDLKVHLHVLYKVIRSKKSDEIKRMLEKDKDVTVHFNVSDNAKDKLYKKADLFVLPTHMDTLGWVFFEAFAYGMPIISIENFSVPETVTNGVDGVVLENYFSMFDENCVNKYSFRTEHEVDEITSNPPKKFVKLLSDTMFDLVVDRKKRETMGAKGFEKVKNGKLSITVKQKQIEQIVHDSLRDALK